MITKFVTQHECMSSILIFGLISLLLQAMMVLSLKGYVRASANMKTTKNKVMINLKNQFETIYGMDYQVRNAAAYVDKYLLKLRFMGFSYSAWEKAPFLAAGLVTLLAGAEAFYGYLTGVNLSAQVEILFAYGVVVACLFIFFHIFGVKSKRQQIQIQLVDYLENYLANRLLRTKGDVRVLDEQTENAAGSAEEDMEMLTRLIREMERKQQEQERLQEEARTEQQIAASEEEPQWQEAPAPKDPKEAELDLLEEFVQSFLS
ncbi:MAG: hypothetical protein NC124_13800 [Clostridium sp.]|nr:hypothetical protein [Clostridium sp.]